MRYWHGKDFNFFDSIIDIIYRISHQSYNGKQFVLKLSNGYRMLSLILKLIR